MGLSEPEPTPSPTPAPTPAPVSVNAVPTSDSPGFTARSSMSLQIATTQDVSLEELRIEPTFLSNLESSIAVGLGVLVDQVMVTKVEVDSRRLQADPEGVPARHLQSTALKVDYEVYMSGDAEAGRIGDSMKGDFSEAFQKELQAKEKASGRTVVVDSITVASVDVVERSDSISDAKEAAKEKAKTTTTTTSTIATTKKPTVVSATEAPATTTADENIDAQTSSATSRMFPHVCLVSIGVLAAWL
eukprot:gnl/MRDRNA2_/MRDRNA2_104732_c0_seq1.p1 gnl/MRDRNA2_/MRDRNA2_104732_c0~~gnl/MRDRNA2_/MRDRNA2_104732_c0_seq1.p1  ORF type:complete len:263 (-),score=71.16 gnl/MRDRNA2_/MRDRNA2_104732_c0_seq1:659-1393(-)